MRPAPRHQNARGGKPNEGDGMVLLGVRFVDCHERSSRNHSHFFRAAQSVRTAELAATAERTRSFEGSLVDLLCPAQMWMARARCLPG